MPMSFGTEPVAEIEGRFPQLRPLRRCEVAAGGGALGDTFELVAPGVAGGWEKMVANTANESSTLCGAMSRR